MIVRDNKFKYKQYIFRGQQTLISQFLIIGPNEIYLARLSHEICSGTKHYRLRASIAVNMGFEPSKNSNLTHTQNNTVFRESNTAGPNLCNKKYPVGCDKCC